MERLHGLFPPEGGGEAEDVLVWPALRRDGSFPAVAQDAAAAGHVALAGEEEDMGGEREKVVVGAAGMVSGAEEKEEVDHQHSEDWEHLVLQANAPPLHKMPCFVLNVHRYR